MVVRERFPHIATIAMSGENFTEGYPSAIQADAFFQFANTLSTNFAMKSASFWLLLRSARKERRMRLPHSCVPRDRAGYLILICPTCLRPTKFEAMTLDGGLHEAFCPSCGTPVKFEINHEIEPVMKRNDA